MFGRNDPVIETLPQPLREMLKSNVAQKLVEDGDEIERLRRELRYAESVRPFRRYLEYRQMRGSNTPGEPKLAMRFLEELGVIWA